MRSKVSRVGDWLVVRFFPKGVPAPMYLFPSGRGTSEELKGVLDACMADAAENGHPFLMASVQEGQKEILENLYPDRFMFEPTRDYYDYIYSAEDLTFLRGKKYQSKRNFISRFKKQEGGAMSLLGKTILRSVL